MAGEDRKVSGKVSVETIDQSVAHVAYKMAHEMWRDTHREDAKVSDHGFFELVRLCVTALQGRVPYGGSFEEEVKKIAPKG